MSLFVAGLPAAWILVYLRTNLVSRGKKSTTIALDGKMLRGSFDEAKEQSALHLVSTFATETYLLLGQINTHEKSNEITAMPELLALLDLSGTM